MTTFCIGNGKVTIRQATPADHTAMDAIFRRSAKALCLGSYDADTLEAWAGAPWPERFQVSTDNGNEQYVILTGELLVGFGALHIGNKQLVSLFIDPAVAGQGVGHTLLEYLFAQAKAAGLTHLHVDSSLNAVSFYARHGFVEQDRGEFTTQGGVRMASVQMLRQLKGE